MISAPISAAALDAINWNADGLVPVITQDADTGLLLMLAWMNREALQLSVTTGQAVYWSRSRQRLWRKGESSGHVQRVKALRLDCDGDTVLLSVEQIGGIACHTGRRHCFFRQLDNVGNWADVEPIVKDPTEIYSNGL